MDHCRRIQKAVEIQYPFHDAAVIGRTYPGAHPHYFLVAYGRVRGISSRNLHVAGTLFGADGTVLAGADARTIVNKMNWTMVITRIPVKDQRYIFVVTGADDTKHFPIATVEFTIGSAHALAAARGESGPRRGNIPIQYPTIGTTVCPTFTACGGGANAPTKATMNNTGNAANDILGVSVPTGIPGVWAYQFNGVPEGNNYTFHVEDGAGNFGENDDITVDSAACAPMAGPPGEISVGP